MSLIGKHRCRMNLCPDPKDLLLELLLSRKGESVLPLWEQCLNGELKAGDAPQGFAGGAKGCSASGQSRAPTVPQNDEGQKDAFTVHEQCTKGTTVVPEGCYCCPVNLQNCTAESEERKQHSISF